MYIGMQYWQDKLSSGLVRKTLSDGRCIETFPDMPSRQYAFLERSACRRPEHEAVIDDLGRVLTYAQLKEKTDTFADYLEEELHLKRGSHIGLMAYSTVEYVTAFLAVNRIGAVAVIFPTKFKEQEIRSLAARANLDCVICDRHYEGWFDAQQDSSIPMISYLPEEGSFAFDAFRVSGGVHGMQKGCDTQRGQGTEKESSTQKEYAGNYEDVCAMLFTSGTTSKSKGVLLTNYNFVHAAGVYRLAFDITENDRTVIPVPIYTITALSAVIGTFLLVGGTICLQSRFHADQVLSCIRDHSLTYMHAAPTVCSLLLEEREHFPALPSLRRIVCGGSRMSAEKIRKLHEWLPGCEYHNVYGMTETTSPGTIQKEDAFFCPEMASEGFPVPGLTYKVLGDDGRELPPGEIGEICVSGTCIMKGYYQLDTDDYRDGWLKTGDMGYFTEQGYCYVVDRKKDMINRGGEKMTSYDVEEELYAMDGILEAVVVGIPDDLYGEVPAALIKPGKDCRWDQAGIQDYLRSRIAKYKIPVRIIFTDEIPLSTGGKPDRKKIRKILT